MHNTCASAAHNIIHIQVVKSGPAKTTVPTVEINELNQLVQAIART